MATAIPANRASFTLGELAACSGGRLDPAWEGVRVTGVTTDSRAIEPGNLYVALRGERHDGHAFLAQAMKAGATGALVEQDDGVPSGLANVVVPDTRRALGELARLHRTRWGKKLIAITGSAGKTTTKELTAAALRGLGQNVLATAGNLNNDIGLPMTLFGLSDEHDVAVVEIGTGGPGEIAWLTHVAEPEVGVVTTVALAHVAKLGSLEEVADEKCALLRALPKQGVAIYGADSEQLRARANTFGAERVIGFGAHESAELRLSQQRLRADLGMDVSYTIGEDPAAHGCELSLYGQAAAVDALGALAVVLGLHGAALLAAAGGGLRGLKPLPGRMRPHHGPQGSLVIDDSYNADPASMETSLQTLVEVARLRSGRAIAALGDMAELGAHARAEHERIGRSVVALGLSDVVFCGAEMAHAARAAQQEVKKRRAKGPHVTHVTEPLSAATELMRALDARAAVLVKGSRASAMERLVDALCPDAEGGA
jgi:UDP-N-acetylmuramoyl-tripeptide--D-alanyl-D-alanine ligase